MTPDANDLCVFAVKRGNLERKRADVLGTYSSIIYDSVYLYPSEKLGQIVSTYNGGTPSKKGNEDNSYWGGTIPWVSPKDFKSFYIYDSEDHITEKAIDDSATQRVVPDSVLVVVRSGILKHTLPVAVNKVEVTINQDIKVLIPNDSVLPDYLGFYLKVFEKKILSLCVKHSTTVQSVNTSEFLSLDIPVPPISTQKKLIIFMKEALNNYRSKLREATELLLGRNQYVLQRIGLAFEKNESYIIYAMEFKELEERLDADYYSPEFSGFRRQIENCMYPSATIDEISDQIVSGFAAGKQDQADDLPDDQRVAHLRPFSITPEGELSFETKKFVPKSRLKPEDYCRKNEVIFNNTNSPDLVGKTTVFDRDVLCAASNHMTRITVKEGVNPYYVAAFFNVLLNIGYWKLLCTNFNNQAGVNTDTLKKVKIPLPPKEVQDQIAVELMQRRSQANNLRKQAIKEWAEAKAQFEKELLGE